VVDCRDGKFIANKNDMYVGRSLIKYGEFSYQEMDAFKLTCAPNDVIVEIGANIGAHTVGLAKIAGTGGRVVAIEPQPVIFQNLCGNISINSLTNVDCLNLLMSNEEGTGYIPPYNYAADGNFGSAELAETDSGHEIPKARLDDIFQYPRLKMLKIDVEGMERFVIEGAEEVIRTHKPILFVENDRLENSQALIEHIFGLGYDLWWHISPLFSENNFNGDTENIYKGIVSANMVGIHRSVNTKVDLTKVENSDYHPMKP
jgi:FkbM family methyltransferase